MRILGNFVLAVALGLLLASILSMMRRSSGNVAYVQYDDEAGEPDVDYSPRREQMALRHSQD